MCDDDYTPSIIPSVSSVAGGVVSGLGSLMTGLVSALGPVVVGAVALVAVVAFVVANLLLIAAGVGVLGLGTLAVMQFLKRFMVVVHDPPRAAPNQTAEISRGYPLPRNLAITQAPRAIEAPAQHVHFHFHGMSAEDVVTITRKEIQS